MKAPVKLSPVKIECLSGNVYEANMLESTKQLPKSAKIHECELIAVNSIITEHCTIWISFGRKGKKLYATFKPF